MILSADDPPILSLPGIQVVSIALVLPNVGTIPQKSMLMKLNADQLEVAQAGSPDLRGWPTYWSPIDAGVVLWPPHNEDIMLEIRDSRGRIVGGKQKPVAMNPVNEYLDAFKTTQASAQARAGLPTQMLPVMMPEGEE